MGGLNLLFSTLPEMRAEIAKSSNQYSRSSIRSPQFGGGILSR